MKQDIPHGHKFDSGKPKFELIPIKAYRLVAEVLTGGAQKYNENNWTGLKASRIIGAAYRHLNKFLSGQDLDLDSKMHHGGHFLANLMMLHHIINNFPIQDDRYNYNNEKNVEIEEDKHIYRKSRGITDIPQYSLVPPDALEAAAIAFTKFLDLNDGNENWIRSLNHKEVVDYALHGFLNVLERKSDDLGPAIAYAMVLIDQLDIKELDDRIFTYLNRG